MQIGCLIESPKQFAFFRFRINQREALRKCFARHRTGGFDNVIYGEEQRRRESTPRPFVSGFLLGPFVEDAVKRWLRPRTNDPGFL